MNKKTPVIKNYILSTDVVYLYNNIEEDKHHRNNCKKINVYISKIKNSNFNKENGASIPD